MRAKRIAANSEELATKYSDSVGKRKKESEAIPPARKALVSTGSTLLNLALSGDPNAGYVPGGLVNIVGDSSAGKTFLLWTMFAEAARNQVTKYYDFIYDEPEAAFYMKAEELFGLGSGRVQTDVRSRTIQDFYRNTMRRIRSGEKFIYGLDSLDFVGSKEELARAESLLEKDKDEGSYKTEKARWMSEILRNTVQELEKTDSFLFIISQTRQKIGMAFGDKKYRSGGDALRFAATHEIWLAVLGHIKRREREVGVRVLAKVKKNKLVGKLRTVSFPIYSNEQGVDDVSSMVDFLVEEKFWSQGGRMIIPASNAFPEMQRESLIKYIEEHDLLDELKVATTNAWEEIECSLSLDRKPKYTDIVESKG